MKEQHTVSEAYLRGFTLPESLRTLWEYNKSTGVFERRNVDKATRWFYGYSYRDENGEWNHDGERRFQRIEDTGIPALKKAIEAGTDAGLSRSERHSLSSFVAASYRRPRVLVEHMQAAAMAFGNDRERQLQMLDDFDAEYGSTCQPDAVKGARDAIVGGVLDANADEMKAMQLAHLFPALNRGAELVGGMYWRILFAKPPLFFVTSDAPAFARIISDPSRLHDQFIHVWRNDAELTFPLSRQRLLLARHCHWNEAARASKTRVRELNARIIRMAPERVYAPFECNLVKSVCLQNRSIQPPLPVLENPR